MLMIWFYRLIYLPGLLITLPYYILRMWRRGGYAKSFQHRFGLFHHLGPVAAKKKRIWLQAVSVGEVLAIGPLIDALQNDPNIEIVLTTTTSTGYAQAQKRYSKSVKSIGIFPLDFLVFSQIAWSRIQPSAVILTESELWPEHLHQAGKRKIPAYLVNARISDTRFRRYQQVPILTRRLLKKFCGIYAASELDKARLLKLGCPEKRIHSTGSIKFDIAICERCNEEARTALREALGFGAKDKQVFILLGSSTWAGEESALLEAQRVVIAEGIDCRLLLVPRHVERAPEIIKLLKAQNLPWYQRSKGGILPENLGIHLADTTGELAHLSQIADLAFIGKSLAPNEGGQTPIEAAGLGVPVLMGSKMNNFKDIAKSLIHAGAALTVEHDADLRSQVLKLAKDQSSRLKMQKSGQDWHERNSGSSQRIAMLILKSL